MAELFKILLNDLRAIRKNFNRLISVGMVFALIGLFYVVEPYFQYKKEEKHAAKELGEKQEHLKELYSQLEYLKNTHNRINKNLRNIRTEIQTFPDHLRQMLPEIQRSISSAPTSQAFQQSVPLSTGGIVLPPDVKTFEEGVRWYTNEWFSGIINELKGEVIEPVLEIRMESGAVTKTRLESLSKSAIEKIRTYVENVNPDFWRSYGGGKVPVAKGLDEVVQESFEPIYNETKRLMDEVNNSVTILDKELQQVENLIAESKNQIAKLDSRIKSLESPIGQIPIDLTDFIKLFPLLMVIIIDKLVKSQHFATI